MLTSGMRLLPHPKIRKLPKLYFHLWIIQFWQFSFKRIPSIGIACFVIIVKIIRDLGFNLRGWISSTLRKETQSHNN